jgi:hypothetical protein
MTQKNDFRISIRKALGNPIALILRAIIYYDDLQGQEVFPDVQYPFHATLKGFFFIEARNDDGKRYGLCEPFAMIVDSSGFMTAKAAPDIIAL